MIETGVLIEQEVFEVVLTGQVVVSFDALVHEVGSHATFRHKRVVRCIRTVISLLFV